MKKSKQNPLVVLAICAMLSAMSFVLMLLEFPVTPPAMGHLKMDFSDVPALFVGVFFGPLYAIVVELVKNLLEFVSKGMATQMGFGNIMNFIVGCAFVVPFSFVLRRKEDKMKDTKTIITAGVIGVISIIVLGVCANYFIAPLFFKYFMGVEIGGEALKAAVASATALNAIKGVMLAVVSFPLVKGMLDAVRKIVKAA